MASSIRLMRGDARKWRLVYAWCAAMRVHGVENVRKARYCSPAQAKGAYNILYSMTALGVFLLTFRQSAWRGFPSNENRLEECILRLCSYKKYIVNYFLIKRRSGSNHRPNVNRSTLFQLSYMHGCNVEIYRASVSVVHVQLPPWPALYG